MKLEKKNTDDNRVVICNLVPPRPEIGKELRSWDENNIEGNKQHK